MPAGKQRPHVGETGTAGGKPRGTPAPSGTHLHSHLGQQQHTERRAAGDPQGPAAPRAPRPPPALRPRGETAPLHPGALEVPRAAGGPPARRLQVGTEDPAGRRAGPRPQGLRRPRGVITAAPRGAGGGVAARRRGRWWSTSPHRGRAAGGGGRAGEAERIGEGRRGGSRRSWQGRRGGELEEEGRRGDRRGREEAAESGRQGGAEGRRAGEDPCARPPAGRGLAQLPVGARLERWPGGSECEQLEPPPPVPSEPAVAPHRPRAARPAPPGPDLCRLWLRHLPPTK